MKQSKECLLIGDSNFINKQIFNINNTQKSLCLGELIQYRLEKENIKIFNFSYWGENMMDIYRRFIINGPLPNKNPKLIFIGELSEVQAVDELTQNFWRIFMFGNRRSQTYLRF